MVTNGQSHINGSNNKLGGGTGMGQGGSIKAGGT